MKRFRRVLLALVTLLMAVSLVVNLLAPSEDRGASSYHHQQVHSVLQGSRKGVTLNPPEIKPSKTSPPIAVLQQLLMTSPTASDEAPLQQAIVDEAEENIAKTQQLKKESNSGAAPLQPRDAIAGEPGEIVAKTQQLQKASGTNDDFLPAMVKLAVQYEGYDASVTLPPKVISGVKKLVLFLCWGRSGSSILGSLLDAHEHIVVTNEFYVPSRLENFDKANLFNRIYYHSIHDPIRGDTWKGYNLKVKGLSHGNYSDFIEVMGDKGDETMLMSYVHDKQRFKENYQNLMKTLAIPIRFLHSIRNPFDIIATTTLIEEFGVRKFRTLKDLNAKNQTAAAMKIDMQILSRNTARVFDLLDAAEDLIEDVIGEENVLVLHHHDLVYDPRGTICKVFEFLEVETTKEYMDACVGKIFKSVSRSRNAIAWTPEQIEMVTARMKRFSIWDRYSFTSD